MTPLDVLLAVAPLYDFASAGPGEYTFEPLVAVARGVASTLLSPTLKSTRPQDLKVNVATDVADRLLESPFYKRAVNTCQDESRKRIIDARWVLLFVLSHASQNLIFCLSYRESRGLARLAANYIGRNGDDELFKEYFKTNDANTIRQSFRNVARENVSTRSYAPFLYAPVNISSGLSSSRLNCRDETGDCKGGRTIAYTVIRTGNVRTIPFALVMYGQRWLCEDRYTTAIYSTRRSLYEICAGTSRSTTAGSGVGPRFTRYADRCLLCDYSLANCVLNMKMIHGNSFENAAPRADWILDAGYGCDFDKTLDAQQQAHNADNYNVRTYIWFFRGVIHEKLTSTSPLSSVSPHKCTRIWHVRIVDG